MKKIIGCFLIATSLLACAEKKEAKPQEVLVVTDYNEVITKFSANDDKLYVVNFWATWCKPCVEELPHFMEVNKEMQNDENFEMILVSLDKASDFETKMKPFITQNNITTDIYLLSDNKRMNEWITALNPHWSGGIPATFIYKNGKQVSFTEGQLSKNELQTIINKYL